MKPTQAILDALEAARNDGRIVEGPATVLPPTPPDPVSVDSGPVELHLPYPPSVNTYYRNVMGRVLISEQGRQYRKAVAFVVASTIKPDQCFTGRLSVAILAHPPDNRARDLDNLLKATLDAMQHVRVFQSDSQIDLLMIRRGNVQPGGELFVVVKTVMEETP